MIENNNNLENTETNEFDKMLNDYINSIDDISIDNKKEVSQSVMDGEYQMYREKGVDYMIPKAANEVCVFHESTFFLNLESFIPKDGKDPIIYVKPTGACHEHAFDINRIDSCCDDKPMAHTIFLYRVGESRPIATETITPRYGDITYYLKDAGGLPVGDYFFLLNSLEPQNIEPPFSSMAHCVRYSFSIKPDGEYLNQPNPISVKVKPNGRQSALYSTDSLKISFTFDTPSKGDEILRLTCLDSNFYKMGEAIVGAKKRGRCYSFQLFARNIWMPGEYTLFMEINGHPSFSVKFTMSEEGIMCDHPNPIEYASETYNLVKYLEPDKDVWQKLCNIPGVGRLKRRVIQEYAHQLVDSERQKNGLTELYSNRNYMIEFRNAYTYTRAVELFRRAMFLNGLYTEGNCHTLSEINPNNPIELTDMISSLFSFDTDKTVCLTHIDGILADKGNIAQKMTEFLKHGAGQNIILCGTRSEIDSLLEIYPTLKRFFRDENRLAIEPFTAAEIAHLFQKKFLDYDLELSETAERRFAKAIANAHAQGMFETWSESEVTDFVENNIISHVRHRMASKIKDMDFQLRTIEEEDIDFKALSGTKISFDDSMRELNDMVGLAGLKQNLAATFNRTRFNTIRREMGLKASDEGAHHMIFTGNPGTGKTTVAKKVGRIYRALGLLSKGEVIYTERSRMVGRYIGETEQNMRSILQQAKGNVLFVDEAYTLCDTSEDRKDFGYHALESLLTVLAQKNPDMIVIFAGYEKEIERMFKANQGLAGRFPHHFKFEDYSADELMQIARKLIANEDYILDSEAETLLQTTITDSVEHKDEAFSNARWLGYYVDAIITAVSDRLLSSGAEMTLTACSTITTADVNTAYEKFRYRPSAINDSRIASLSPLPRVGFRIA